MNGFTNHCFCYICTMKKQLLLLIFACSSMCSCVRAPQPDYPVPTRQQLEWQQLETYAFVHFGLNTFNDLEWGYGDTPASTFNPVELDCEQWVQTFKACGMKGVILTAKHHDGFCLWPTKTTDYNISNSPYKNGKGNMVKELSDACHKYGLKFGIYLSPWDRNNAEYGKEAYVETYHKQIEELTTNYGELFEFWFDGANGGTGWYGGADEMRSIEASKYYDYERARNTIWKNNPDAMIFGGTMQTIRWVGNEQGWAGETQWSMVKMSNIDDCDYLTRGDKNGDVWLPAEVDVSIRPGWFYSPSTDDKVKSVEQLMDIWFGSVGRGGNLLLNVPPDRRGMIHPADSARLMEFKAAREAFLAGAVGSASREGRAVKVPSGHEVSAVVVCEDISKGQKISSFVVEGMKDGRWSVLAEGTTVGHKRILRFEPCCCEKVRVRVTGSYGRSRISYTVI